MIKRVLVDAGPLVAILVPSDPHNQSCVDEVRRHRQPLLTCWPVLAEAAYLVRKQKNGVHRLFDFIRNSTVEVAELDAKAPLWVADFLDRYAYINAQVADACLMYLLELEKTDTVFTIDRRDFSVYQKTDGSSVNIVPAI